MLPLLLLVALSSPALANGVIALAPHNLFPRQDQSFTPPTSIENGCASNEVQCPGEFNGLPYCVTPSRGDICCAEGYGCPGNDGGSFCLINGLCCPNGVDPATCATEQGVTLPDGFTAGKTVAFTAGSSATVLPAPSSPTTAQPTTTEAVPVTSTSSSTVAVITTTSLPPYVVPSNSTIPGPTATGTGAGPSKSVIPFTGDANAVFEKRHGTLAAIIGIAGLLLW